MPRIASPFSGLPVVRVTLPVEAFMATAWPIIGPFGGNAGAIPGVGPRIEPPEESGCAPEESGCAPGATP